MVATMEAPAILSKPRRAYSSNAELSAKVRRECEDAVVAMAGDISRANRAWEVYLAVNGSQYDEKKRKVFKEEDRKPWQFDFASAKIDTLAGTIIAELPDPDWAPIMGDRTRAIDAIKESYYSDKELFNYSMVLLETIRDGCVHNGWCQIGESRKYHPIGNISLQRVRPGYLIKDPYWLTSDDRDQMRCYKLGWFDAEMLKQVWSAQSDAINVALYELKSGRRQAPPDDIIEQQRKREPHVGDEWQVIENHYLEVKKTARLIGLRNGADMLSDRLFWIPFPVSEDRDYLESFATENDIDWETVREVPYEERIHKVRTVTDLDPNIVLEDAVSRVQCNGLPFLHFTTTRVDGRDKGVMETIMDLQEMFNERMSHVHELVAKASGGSEIWNEDLFRDPQQKQRFIKNRNKPGHTEFAPLDDVKVAKAEVGHIQVNPAIFQQVSVLYNELLPLVSRVSDTMSAMSGSEDTGVLFERKYQMNRIANILFDKFAKQLINNLGECYFYQWQVTYADAERVITTRKGDEIVINRVEDRGGVPVMINSVAHVPRCRVIVSENTSSPTFQMNTRMQIREIIKTIPENDYLRLNQVLSAYFNALNLSEKDKAMMEMVSEMNNMKAQVQFMTEMSGMKAQMANNEVMIAQADRMMQQIQGMMAQPAAPTAPDQITGPEQMTQPVRQSAGPAQAAPVLQ